MFKKKVSECANDPQTARQYARFSQDFELMRCYFQDLSGGRFEFQLHNEVVSYDSWDEQYEVSLIYSLIRNQVETCLYFEVGSAGITLCVADHSLPSVYSIYKYTEPQKYVLFSSPRILAEQLSEEYYEIAHSALRSMDCNGYFCLAKDRSLLELKESLETYLAKQDVVFEVLSSGYCTVRSALTRKGLKLLTGKAFAAQDSIRKRMVIDLKPVSELNVVTGLSSHEVYLSILRKTLTTASIRRIKYYA